MIEHAILSGRVKEAEAYPKSGATYEKYLDDILVLIGAVLIVGGVWLLSTPAGLITAGLFCILIGGLLGIGRFER